MKYIVTIEETNVKGFTVEANSAKGAYEIAKTKYKSGELVLDPGECQFRQIAITGPNENDADWQKF